MKRLCNLMPPRPEHCLLVHAYRPVCDPAGPHQVVRWMWVGQEPVGNPAESHGEPSANPGETQRVSRTPESGAIGGETPPFFPDKTPESGGLDLSEGGAICTPVSVTHRHAASRSDSVTSRDPSLKPS